MLIGFVVLLVLAAGGAAYFLLRPAAQPTEIKDGQTRVSQVVPTYYRAAKASVSGKVGKLPSGGKGDLYEVSISGTPDSSTNSAFILAACRNLAQPNSAIMLKASNIASPTWTPCNQQMLQVHP